MYTVVQSDAGTETFELALELYISCADAEGVGEGSP